MASFSFYALSTTPTDKALPRFVEKLYAKGIGCVIKTTTPERVKHVSHILWTYKSAAFLPHGYGPEEKDDQPIWITHQDEVCPEKEALILIDGAECDILDNALTAYTRYHYFFDCTLSDTSAQAFAYYHTIKNVCDPQTLWKQTPQGEWEKGDPASFFQV
jgi:DNA polymerase-3 subunit chi